MSKKIITTKDAPAAAGPYAQAAISVPCGFTESGLPIGLMIHGRKFDDELVLRVAHTYEQTAGAPVTWPSL